MKDKIISISSYGMVLVSQTVLKNFLKENKIRSKKVVQAFQDNHTLYLDSISKGIWLPILPIDSVKYSIKISNDGDSFDDEWEKNIEEPGFNLSVIDTFWILGIGALDDLVKENFGTEMMSYQTLDGHTLNQGFRFDYASGKYLIKIEGFRRRIERQFPESNYGFLFTLEHIDKFDGYKDPREDEKYYFNIAQPR